MPIRRNSATWRWLTRWVRDALRHPIGLVLKGDQGQINLLKGAMFVQSPGSTGLPVLVHPWRVRPVRMNAAEAVVAGIRRQVARAPSPGRLEAGGYANNSCAAAGLDDDHESLRGPCDQPRDPLPAGAEGLFSLINTTGGRRAPRAEGRSRGPGER